MCTEWVYYIYLNVFVLEKMKQMELWLVVPTYHSKKKKGERKSTQLLRKADFTVICNTVPDWAMHLSVSQKHVLFSVFFKWNCCEETPGPFHLKHPLPAVSVLEACCSANKKRKKILLIIFLCFRAQYAETGKEQTHTHSLTHSHSHVDIYPHKHTCKALPAYCSFVPIP